MYRNIIVAKKRKFSIEFPENYIGKSVEIIAFPIEQNSVETEEYSWDEIKNFYYSIKPKTDNFKFNRDEANER